MAARRNISPARGRQSIETTIPVVPDERDLIVKKLKQELIIARSKQKQVSILDNYLIELKQKIKLTEEQIRRKQADIRNKNDYSQKAIIQLKRQIEIYKGELKNNNIQLGEKEASLVQMRRHLSRRATQMDKIRKQTLFLKEENDRLNDQNSKCLLREDEIMGELQRIQSTNRNYQAKLSDLNAKIGQVKAMIGNLNNQAQILNEKLKKYEQQNNHISDNLSIKQQKIDDLQRVFAEQHDQIKEQIDNFIELEHKNQKVLTEIRHKINLNKAQNQKTAQLTLTIQKIDKSITNIKRQNTQVQQQMSQYSKRNSQYTKFNAQLANDLTKCQAHLQNLLKYNHQIQEQLDKYIREDEQIISVIRRKRALDVIPVPMRQSRKYTDRTFI